MECTIHSTEGEVFRLRPYDEDDVDLLFDAATESVEHLSRWMPWCHANYSRHEASSWLKLRSLAWKAGKEFDFAVIDSNERLVGACGLNEISMHRLASNLGYWIRSGETGKGLATAAARSVARFGFEELGLQRIEIVAAVGNDVSQRVAEKVNAVREGIARNRLRLHDVMHDAVIFSLTPKDL